MKWVAVAACVLGAVYLDVHAMRDQAKGLLVIAALIGLFASAKE